MTGEEMRDQLADTLYAHGVLPWRCPVLADALLPVVRKIAAAELRAAGDDKRMPRNGTNICRARAKALDPS